MASVQRVFAPYPSSLRQSPTQWLRVRLTRECLSTASERQSGWALRCGQRRKSVGVQSNVGPSSQYSSGSRTVVALRSASVMIQILVPVFRV